MPTARASTGLARWHDEAPEEGSKVKARCARAVCLVATLAGLAPGSLAQAQTETVEAIPGIIAGGATFTRVFQTVGNNVDGIVASADGSLLASQEDNNAVLQIDHNDRASIYLAGVAVGSLSIDRQGRLFAVRRMAQTGTPASTQASAPQTSGISMLLPDLRMWDTLADGTGGAYFTQERVYYASASGTISLVGENLRGNGVLLSEDDTRLYVTNESAIVVFDVQGPGRLTNQRSFSTLAAGGNADGLAVDTAGNLYVAAGPGIQVYDRQARHLGVIPTPPGRPTGQAFAGRDRKTLYVVVQSTTDAHGRPMAGRTIYRIPTLAQGLPVRSK